MVKFEVTIGIITSPRRLPTLDVSIESLRKAGYEGRVFIFSEPGPLFLNGYYTQVIQHSEKLGAFGNYDFALNWLLDNRKSHFICVLEDDYVYTEMFMPLLYQIAEQKNFGYYNLFTNKLQPGLGELPRGWSEIKLGWHSWGVGYVFERGNVEKIIKHEIYQKTLKENNMNIDAAVSEACLQLGLPMFYHNPSACYSIGYLSTLGHKTFNDGYGL